MGNSPGSIDYSKYPLVGPPTTPTPAPPTGGIDYSKYAVVGAQPAPSSESAGIDYSKYSVAGNPTTTQKSEGIDYYKYSTVDQEPESTTWYGKAWDWANKPLLDLHRSGAGGLESGVEDVLSGLTSPLSFGLMLGTAGLGSLLETAGYATGTRLLALRAMGVAAKETPVVMQATRALIDAGFTAQQVGGLAREFPQFLDALKQGDWESAQRIGVNVAAGSAFGALGVHRAFTDFGAFAEKTGLKTPNEHLAAVREKYGDYQLKEQLAASRKQKNLVEGYKALEDPSRLPEEKVASEENAEGRAKPPAPQPHLEEAKQWKAENLKPGEETLDAYKGNPARTEYRTKVADQFQANVIDKAPDVPEDRKPNAYITLGGTASGKSSLINKILKRNPGLPNINTDENRLQIPEYGQLKEIDQKHAAARVHKEASLITEDILNRTIAAGKDFLYDSTTSGGDAEALIKDLKAKGYRVVLQGVHVPTDEALVREGARAKLSDDPVNRGRQTPREKILANHKGAVENWNKLKDLADEAHLYDNTGKTLRQILSVVDGEETWHTEDAKDVHEAFQAKANGSEKRLLHTDEEIENAVNQRIQEIQASRAKLGPSAGTDAGGDGTVQEGVEGTVRPGAAGARPAGGDVPEPGNGPHRLASGRGAVVEKLSDADKSRRAGAIFLYNEADGDKARLGQELEALKASTEFKKNHSAKEQADIFAKYEEAMKMSPEQARVAEAVAGNLNDDYLLNYQHGLVGAAAENYQTHVWGDKPTDNPAVNFRKFQASRGDFDTNVPYGKHRVFSSAFEGRMLGYKLKSDDAIQLMAEYRYRTQKAIAAREFLEDLHDSGLRLPDGRAVVAGSGSGTTLHTDENPITFVDPKRIRSLRINAKMIAAMEESGELQRHLTNGTIKQLAMESVRLPEDVQEQLQKNPLELKENIESGQIKQAPDGTLFGIRPVYGWETGDYRAVNHPAMRDWFFATNAADNSPVFVKSDIRVHPDAHTFIERALGADKSPIRDFKVGNVEVGKFALKASTQGKALTLSLSPFHVVQEGLRAIMTGISPFGKLDVDLENNTKLQYGVAHSLTLFRHDAELHDLQEGVSSHSAVINKIPGLRQAQGAMQHFLFDRYIPSLKARAYSSLFDRYRAEYPEASASEAATMAAEHANSVFGGLNYKMMGRSMASQDVMRMTLLAPDWLESEARMLKRTLDPQHGAIMRQDIARISLYTFAAARLLNMLTTGKPHMEAPFGVVVPGQKGEDDKVFSFRTPPVDLVHMVSDPRGFLAGRLNPLTVKPGIEGITGRDYFGRKVTPGQEALDSITNFVPIAAQLPSKKLLNIQDTSNPEMVARAMGMSVNRYRTEAEKLAQEKASDRMPSGPVSEQELANHQRNIRLEDLLRNGNISPAQIRQQLPRTVAQNIIDSASLTPLQARFKRLPLGDALEVWDMALPREKEELVGEMRQKRAAYLKSHHAQERATDPNWRKLQAIFGSGSV